MASFLRIICCRKRLIRYATGTASSSSGGGGGTTAHLPQLEEQLPLEELLQLTEEVEEHLCGSQPWLVLHKLDPPSRTRFVGQRFAACEAAAAAAPALDGLS